MWRENAINTAISNYGAQYRQIWNSRKANISSSSEGEIMSYLFKHKKEITKRAILLQQQQAWIKAKIKETNLKNFEITYEELITSKEGNRSKLNTLSSYIGCGPKKTIWPPKLTKQTRLKDFDKIYHEIENLARNYNINNKKSKLIIRLKEPRLQDFLIIQHFNACKLSSSERRLRLKNYQHGQGSKT